MTPDHFETIVDGSRAPLSAAYADNPLNPKRLRSFSMPAHLEEIGRLTPSRWHSVGMRIWSHSMWFSTE